MPEPTRPQLKLSDALPAFTGFTLASAVVAFVVTGLVANSRFGRPSSTDALVIPFGAVLAVVAGLVGFAVGFLAWGAVRLFHLREPEPAKLGAWLVGIYAIVVLAAAGSALTLVLTGERQAAPRVLADAGQVRTVPVPVAGAPVRRVVLLYSLPLPTQPSHVELDSLAPTVSVAGDRVIVRERRSGAARSIAAPGLDYVAEVHGSVLHDRQARRYLVLVISGRATGHRAILAILTPGLDVLYQERLELPWRDTPLEIRYDSAAGTEVAVLCPSCARPKAFAIGLRTGP
jgi:hypothetical protein